LDRERLYPDRVIVQVLDYGQTAFATRSALFAVAPELVGTDRLGDVGEWAHARGIECWAAVDLLRWCRPTEAGELDPFRKQPEFMALDEHGVALRQPDGKFASPFNPAVHDGLVEFVRELGANYPDLDGILLTCRLSVHLRMLGMDELSRVVYIGRRRLDPLDLRICCATPEEDPEVREYFAWRLQMAGDLVGQVASAFRQAVPRGKVAVVGQGNFYRLRAKLQATTCMDWLSWVTDRYADEVILEPDWGGLAYWDEAANLMSKCRDPVPITALVTSRPAYQHYELMTAWNGYHGHGGAVDRVVVDPYYPEYLEDAEAILRRALAWRERTK
jgi:uncharacterized lipoprotein YddW (UPF0748 family)